MLGQPVSMLIPEVVGFKLHGKLPPGATATDLVLTVTEMLRKKKVVGKFVEFYGTGLSSLPLADRATIANMAPEYGATMGFFPCDEETLKYLRLSGRPEHHVKLVEAYTKEQGLFRTDSTPDPDVHRYARARPRDGRAEPRRPEAPAGPRAALEVEVDVREALDAELAKLAGRGIAGKDSSRAVAASASGGGGVAVAEPAVAAKPARRWSTTGTRSR